jgi:peptidoglycan/LPS O-acetylase OafA/YrhL
MKQTFQALNGLRFFAALAVVCYHYGRMTTGFTNVPMFLQNIASAGPIALGFFYILSGFVLAHAHADRNLQTKEARRSFWFHRFARLYPVYLLAFLLFLPMAYEKYLRHPAPDIHGARTFVLGGALNLLAVQAWTPLSQSWNGPSWSLSVEAFFYFLFPFVMLPILRLRWTRLLPILALLWAAMLTLPLAHERMFISEGLWQNWIQNNPLFWSPLFLIGVAAYRLYPAWRSTSEVKATWYGVATVVALVLLCGVLSPSNRELFISGGAAPLLAMIVVAYTHPSSLTSRVIGTNLLYEAGAASYITYILQSPVWHIYRLITDRMRHASEGQFVANWQFFVFAAVLLAVSFIVQATVERPAQRWLLSHSPFTEIRKDRSLPTDPNDKAASPLPRAR